MFKRIATAPSAFIRGVFMVTRVVCSPGGEGILVFSAPVSFLFLFFLILISMFLPSSCLSAVEGR